MKRKGDKPSLRFYAMSLALNISLSKIATACLFCSRSRNREAKYNYQMDLLEAISEADGIAIEECERETYDYFSLFLDGIMRDCFNHKAGRIKRNVYRKFFGKYFDEKHDCSKCSAEKSKKNEKKTDNVLFGDFVKS